MRIETFSPTQEHIKGDFLDSHPMLTNLKRFWEGALLVALPVGITTLFFGAVLNPPYGNAMIMESGALILAAGVTNLFWPRRK